MDFGYSPSVFAGEKCVDTCGGCIEGDKDIAKQYYISICCEWSAPVLSRRGSLALEVHERGVSLHGLLLEIAASEVQ